MQEDGRLTRRSLLPGLQLGDLAGSSRPQISKKETGGGSWLAAEPHFLLQINLKGGMDGLTSLCPFDDPAYQSLRAETRLYGPNAGMSTERTVTPLAGNMMTATGTAPAFLPSFGLPRALLPLKSIYDAGDLVFVNGVGNIGGPQSHFAAKDIMERGASVDPSITLPSDGWLARHLASKTDHLGGVDRKFRAMSYRTIQAISLFGADTATPISDPTNYSFPDDLMVGSSRVDLLRDMFLSYGEPFDTAFETTEEAVNVLSAINFAGVAGYPATPLGGQLKNIAAIAKQSNVEIISIPFENWDTHRNQGVYEGGPSGQAMFDLMSELAGALKAFYDDMSTQSRKFAVLVITEFGRTSHENASQGTDHGKGTVAFLISPDCAGGRIVGDWGGLEPHNLDDLDLEATIDIRDVMREVADKALFNPAPAQIFQSVDSGYVPRSLGLFL